MGTATVLAVTAAGGISAYIIVPRVLNRLIAFNDPPEWTPPPVEVQHAFLNNPPPMPCKVGDAVQFLLPGETRNPLGRLATGKVTQILGIGMCQRWEIHVQSGAYTWTVSPEQILGVVNDA